jgi:hypothetical protein
MRVNVVKFVQHRLSSHLSLRKRRTNVFLHQHKTQCEQMIDEFLVWKRLHAEAANYRRTYNQHTQRLQLVIYFLHIQNLLNRFKDNEEQVNKRRKAHYVKRFQSSSFYVKRSFQINSTRCDELAYKRRSANLHAAHIIDEHSHLRSATFE